ncbi:MAG: S8 family serine peptidase, partial [Crocinitomicaceae bacterium]|nr:S8 family serine peptidase [Crocinitomicaceae bacterium]
MQIKLRIILVAAVTALISFSAISQVDVNIYEAAFQKVLDETNVNMLNRLISVRSQERQTLIDSIRQKDSIRVNRILIRKLDKEKIDGIDEFGRSFKFVDENGPAAITTRTSSLKKGGNLSLELTGEGLSISVWEQYSGVNTAHKDFRDDSGKSRVQIMQPGGRSPHGTHVAGTIASGSGEISKQGMANMAKVYLYTASNAINEVAQLSSTGPTPLILSNHSYGMNCGWVKRAGIWKWTGDNSVSRKEDYRFGNYMKRTQYIDLVANLAPYSLMVFSGGNDRGTGKTRRGHEVDGGKDGYDCLGPAKVSKNSLIVGYVYDYDWGEDPIQVARSSAFGPTDDGRIKPDICGNGIDIISCSQKGNGYKSNSGSSMAAPNISGSVILAQELFHKRFGSFMTSDMAKGLIIHSAKSNNELDAPDYRMGWGIADFESLATIILNDKSIIRRDTISTETLEFEFSETGSFVATICWNDP